MIKKIGDILETQFTSYKYLDRIWPISKTLTSYYMPVMCPSRPRFGEGTPRNPLPTLRWCDYCERVSYYYLQWTAHWAIAQLRDKSTDPKTAGEARHIRTGHTDLECKEPYFPVWRFGMTSHREEPTACWCSLHPVAYTISGRIFQLENNDAISITARGWNIYWVWWKEIHLIRIVQDLEVGGKRQ